MTIDPGDLAFFDPGSDRGDVLPTVLARSGWGADHLHGVALSGVLARELQYAVTELGRDDLRPARLVVDLFRPARFSPSRTRHVVVRNGPRVCLVDSTFEQDDEVVARASALFLLVSAETEGEVWAPPAADAPVPPPEQVTQVLTEPTMPFIFSEQTGWSQDFAEHQNAERKQHWQYVPRVVAGEEPSPFEVAAQVADSTNMVGNWGSRGVEYINTDISLNLVRLPLGREIGLRATGRLSTDGIAVATAEMYDRAGVLGTTAMSGLANAKRTVDLGGGL